MYISDVDGGSQVLVREKNSAWTNKVSYIFVGVGHEPVLN
jgi:hypothetical protein